MFFIFYSSSCSLALLLFGFYLCTFFLSLLSLPFLFFLILFSCPLLLFPTLMAKSIYAIFLVYQTPPILCTNFFITSKWAEGRRLILILYIYEHSLDMEKEKPAPLFLESLPLSKDISCSFPHEGSVLRIFADKFFKDIHHFVGGEYWVKLYNVAFEIKSGIWKGVMNSSSKVFMLSDEDHKVKCRNR